MSNVTWESSTSGAVFVTEGWGSDVYEDPRKNLLHRGETSTAALVLLAAGTRARIDVLVGSLLGLRAGEGRAARRAVS